ncbi:hypothetical protein EA472_12485 [Natrarchaeobius oligotrophus]|uniref:Uncharacterized protein n=2 Tax=Natrarchaeobius TaxID=2501796 RepID=A0A3N6M8S9_NATCH|nr:hypothetical protein EA472_12485 [Natrarchaeobius chitinivorans]
MLVALGVAGVRYAPAIVESQHRQGMAPLEDETIDDADRVRATKGTGLVVALVGVGLLAYWFVG